MQITAIFSCQAHVNPVGVEVCPLQLSTPSETDSLHATHQPNYQPIAGAAPSTCASEPQVTDEHVTIEGEPFLCIRHVNRMAPFLMTVVSDSDLWLFVGSNTGFTAGHRNPDRALFPYQTVDKILHQPQARGVLTLGGPGSFSGGSGILAVGFLFNLLFA